MASAINGKRITEKDALEKQWKTGRRKKKKKKEDGSGGLNLVASVPVKALEHSKRLCISK